MIEWQAGDIAIAKDDAVCGCGQHTLSARKVYRVGEVGVEKYTNVVYLRMNGEEKFWPHHHFRRETPANTDVFKLAAPSTPEPSAPVKAPEHEDA
jgi:hypothetical protein